MVDERPQKVSRVEEGRAAGVQVARQRVERRERRRGKGERQKVRGDGFLEAQREPRVSCAAGCGNKWPRTIKRTNPAKASYDLGMRGAKERAVTSVIRFN